MTLSNEYKSLLTEMHTKNKKWGSEFKKTPIPEYLQKAINTYKPTSILDFGCGKGFLSKKIQDTYLDINVVGWDPSYGYDLSGNYDMIISTDVLEHVEPAYLNETLVDLYNRTNIVQYHLIACYSAVAVLPDGRNAHLSIHTPDEWQSMFIDNNFKIRDESLNCVLKNKKDNNNKGKKLVVEYEVVLEK